MTYQSLRRDQRSLDLLATDHTPECPYCRELNAAGATVCGDCGGHLIPKTYDRGSRPLSGESESREPQKGIIMASVPGCTCGGNGLCTRCVLAEYDGDPLAGELERALCLLEPSNVVELHGHSKKAAETRVADLRRQLANLEARS